MLDGSLCRNVFDKLIGRSRTCQKRNAFGQQSKAKAKEREVGYFRRYETESIEQAEGYHVRGECPIYLLLRLIADDEATPRCLDVGAG